MTNHQSGHDAEKQAAAYLEKQGCRIQELNWKTKYCEIDIVAKRGEVVWFVEVKSRKSSGQGAGYEYVTSKKLRQMHFAAEMWVQSNNWNGDYRLAVVSVDGETITLIDDV